MAQRIKLEVIYTIPDSASPSVFADKLVGHIDLFIDPTRSRNASRPHYDHLTCCIEKKEWVKINGV